jgi:hypothetical protein
VDLVILVTKRRGYEALWLLSVAQQEDYGLAPLGPILQRWSWDWTQQWASNTKITEGT